MFRSIRNFSIAVLALFAIAAQGPAYAQAREEAKLLVATQVLDELRAQRDQVIPERLLQRAYGVAVIPSVTKVALFFGGRHGSGVLVVRDSHGRFTNPLFINLTGISGGPQFGVQETDIVLVFTTKRGIEGIADGKLTLGAGASVAAGPLGRQAEVAASTTTEVYAYSRARGMFLGLALDGTAISIDRKANRAFYNKRDVLPSEIMSGAVSQDSENVRRFLAALAQSTGESATATVSGGGPAQGGTPASSTPVAPVQGPAAPEAGGVKTFPMEDPAPGKEPPR
ncbi:MAG: lipid-binding SYLF domain-containing protein [Steroidobacteraceae bacterium]